jgi:hypothetical protein
MKTVIAIIAICISTMCYAKKNIDSREYKSIESRIKSHGTAISNKGFLYSMYDSNGNSHTLTLTGEKITVWTMLVGVKEGERSFVGWEINPKEVKLQVEEKRMDAKIESFFAYMIETFTK